MTPKVLFGQGPAQPAVDAALCTVCGTCVQTCPSGTLVLRGRAVQIEPDTEFGCIACGQCMAVCHEGAVTVSGRGMSPADSIPLPPPELRASAAQLEALLLARRSIRRFAEREVSREIVERLLSMAASAPMGIPPSNVQVTVFHGREKVREFQRDTIQAYKYSKVMTSPLVLGLMRLFMKRADYLMMRDFVGGLIRDVLAGDARGEDVLLYDAPLALLFQTSPYADQADATIAATYAMLAAESLGLGTCLIGSVSPFIARAPKVLAKYGIPRGNKLFLTMVAGYPAVKYARTIRRRFGKVDYA